MKITVTFEQFKELQKEGYRHDHESSINAMLGEDAAQSLGIDVRPIQKSIEALNRILGKAVVDQALATGEGILVVVGGPKPPTRFVCSFAKSETTPCIIRDGITALSGDGKCVGCDRSPDITTS